MARTKTSLALDEQILNALSSSPSSTKALAETLREDRGRVYRHCRQLMKQGSLVSTLEPGPRLLFCVEDKKVVTGADYDDCKKNLHPLGAFFSEVRVWRLKPKQGSRAGH